MLDYLSVDNRLTTLYYNEFGNSIICRLLNAANQNEKELFLSSVTMSEALNLLEGSQIYIQVSVSENKTTKEKSFVKFTRVKANLKIE